MKGIAMENEFCKCVGHKMSAKQKAFDSWIAVKWPQPEYSLARYQAARLMEDVLFYGKMTPSETQTAILKDLKARAVVAVEAFGMKLPTVENLKEISLKGGQRQ